MLITVGSSLAKIPLILTFVFAFHYSGTSPNPRSSASEQVEYGRQKKGVLEHILPYIGPSVKVGNKIDITFSDRIADRVQTVHRPAFG